MPGYTGFQLLEFFETPSFEIVFTTAYADYALQAFQVSAIDYLLKPIQISALQKAAEKIERHIGNSQFRERIDTLKNNLKNEGIVSKIALPVSDGLLFVEVKEIIYLKADSAYTHIYLANSTNLLVSKTLKEFEKLIQHPHFFRTHRSFLINLQHVKQYVKNDGGYIVMDNGDIIALSKDKREEFLEAFNNSNSTAG